MIRRLLFFSMYTINPMMNDEEYTTCITDNTLDIFLC